MMPKWAITLEWIRGNWVVLVTYGRGPVRGCTTADDLDTAMTMAKELFEGCLEWPEIAAEKDSIILSPAAPQPEKEKVKS
jgi:predicted RNase H-like HicB family nuclease